MQAYILFEGILSLVLQWEMTKFPENFMDRRISVTESFPTSYFTLPDINAVKSATSTDKSERKDLYMLTLADLDLSL